jgi:formyltetrahydrofolate deformylase
MNQTARLLITCPDRPGIVASVTNFLYSHGANITALDQHSTDAEGGDFFMRLEFTTPHLDVTRAALEQSFQDVVAARFAMTWRIAYAADLKRVAVLVSRHEHCLLELLWRHSRGELPCEIALVISNHPDLRDQVERFGVHFAHLPVTQDTRDQAEEALLDALEGRIDLLVLARYMQILSGRVVARYGERIINIHHSFLPAFAGADPYRQAYERGVKIVGATAHYVTEELDAGPIIAQDIARVSHRQSVEDLKEIGRDLERQVLARAVRAHLEDRIIITGNKTVVF